MAEKKFFLILTLLLVFSSCYVFASPICAFNSMTVGNDGQLKLSDDFNWFDYEIQFQNPNSVNLTYKLKILEGSRFVRSELVNKSFTIPPNSNLKTVIPLKIYKGMIIGSAEPLVYTVECVFPKGSNDDGGMVSFGSTTNTKRFLINYSETSVVADQIFVNSNYKNSFYLNNNGLSEFFFKYTMWFFVSCIVGTLLLVGLTIGLTVLAKKFYKRFFIERC